MRAAVAAAAILALGAIISSGLLWLTLRHTQTEVGPSALRAQRARIVTLEARVRTLANRERVLRRLTISTADSLLLEHRTMGMVIDSQKSLLKVTKAVAQRTTPVATVPRTTPRVRELYGSP